MKIKLTSAYGREVSSGKPLYKLNWDQLQEFAFKAAGVTKKDFADLVNKRIDLISNNYGNYNE